MGKGSALSTWLRELMVLIFTQTMQAFIFAIIISIVLYAMVSTGELTPSESNASLGMMSVFAMFSIFKIEAYAKKIFGMQDSPASPGSAMKSLAKTAFAVSIGKRVLNNVGKFTGGIRKISKAGQDRRKVKKRLDEDMKDEGYEVDKKGNYVKSQKVKVSGQAVGNNSGNGSSSGGGSSEGVTSNSGNVSSGGDSADSVSKADKRRIKNAMRGYEDQLSEINKQRNEGIKDIISSVTETYGAALGAGAGAIIGGASGEFDELTRGLIAGMGAGDYVGESVVKLADKSVQFVQRNANRQRGMSSAKLKAALKDAQSQIDAMTVNNNNASVDDE